MYTLIIAEDECTIAEGIRRMVEQRRPEVSVVGMFENGQQVIDAIKKSKVDLIIADINMPVATGIDIAKYVYENKLHTQIILITGFQQFQYVQDAINYHVYKFLSKPFLVDELVEAIEGAEKIIENVRSSIELQNKNTLLSINNYRSTLSGLYNNISVLRMDNDFDRLFGTGFCYEIKLEIDNMEEYLSYRSAETDDFYSSITDLCEYYFENTLSLCVDIRENCFIFILFLKNMEFLQDYLEHIKKSLSLFYNFEIILEYRKFKSLDELLKNKKYRKTAAEIYDVIKRGDLNYIERYTETIIGKYTNSQLKDICITLIDLKEIKQSPVYEKFHGKILFCYELSQIVQIFKNLLKEVYFSLFNDKELTALVIKYIANNFSKELSIESIAESLSVSPAYLGKIFKNEKGEKLVNYIMHFRINKAKELLIKTNTPLREIGRMVGYNSINYFSKIFKKETGLSLSAYRIANRKNQWN